MLDKKAGVTDSMILWIFRILIVSIALFSLFSYIHSKITKPVFYSQIRGHILIDRLFYTRQGISYYNPLTLSIEPYTLDVSKLNHYNITFKKLFGDAISVVIVLNEQKYILFNKDLFLNVLPFLSQHNSQYTFVTATRYMISNEDGSLVKVDVFMILPK